MKLKTAAVLIDRALDIADTVNENAIGARLSEVLHMTEQRIAQLELE